MVPRLIWRQSNWNFFWLCFFYTRLPKINFSRFFSLKKSMCRLFIAIKLWQWERVKKNTGGMKIPHDPGNTVIIQVQTKMQTSPECRKLKNCLAPTIFRPEALHFLVSKKETMLSLMSRLYHWTTWLLSRPRIGVSLYAHARVTDNKNVIGECSAARKKSRRVKHLSEIIGARLSRRAQWEQHNERALCEITLFLIVDIDGKWSYTGRPMVCWIFESFYVTNLFLPSEILWMRKHGFLTNLYSY